MGIVIATMKCTVLSYKWGIHKDVLARTEWLTGTFE